MRPAGDGMEQQPSTQRQALFPFLQDPPVRPKGHHRRRPNDTAGAGAQLWAASGESCPEGYVPIRRTTEADVLRASSVRRFGRAPDARVRRDSVAGGHEVRHAWANIFGW